MKNSFLSILIYFNHLISLKFKREYPYIITYNHSVLNDINIDVIVSLSYHFDGIFMEMFRVERCINLPLVKSMVTYDRDDLAPYHRSEFI